MREPKDSGFNLSIRIVLVGLFPVKTLKGKRKSAFSPEIHCLTNSAFT